MVYRWPGSGLFPPSCILCGLRSGGGLLCPGCSADLPRLAPGCPTCAGPGGGGRPCGRCQHRPPPYDRTWAAFEYRDEVATLICGLKYHRRLPWAAALGALLAGEVRARGLALPDRLVAWRTSLAAPMPTKNTDRRPPRANVRGKKRRARAKAD